LNHFSIRRFAETDAFSVAGLIAETMRKTNSHDYSAESIENTLARLSPEKLIDRSRWMHFYVVCDRDKIIGCGAIGSYWGKVDESCLFNLFVLPEYQGKGIGRMIIETLEQDEFFLRANRIEVPASMTACGFYQKMGYQYKDNARVIDAGQHISMEKFR